MEVGDVVQFNVNHEWCGCLGVIDNFKAIHNSDLDGKGKNDVRMTIGVPIPREGIAYIFVMQSEHAIELIGKAKLVPKKESEEE